MQGERPKPPVSIVDLSSESSVWLVKIPNYLVDAWIHAERGTELGTITIEHPNTQREGENASQPPIVEMSVIPLPGMRDNIPLQFSCGFQEQKTNEIAIFSEDVAGNITLEGQVKAKVDCKAKDTALLKKSVNAQATAIRERETHDIKVFEAKEVDTFVSRSATITNKLTSKNAKQKKKGEKRERMEQSQLETLIFRAFYKKDLLTLAELDRDLEQPIAYLKEILGKICIYHTSGKNRLHYEIKDEFKNKKPRLEENAEGQQ
jgi:hypothetical protein